MKRIAKTILASIIIPTILYASHGIARKIEDIEDYARRNATYTTVAPRRHEGSTTVHTYKGRYFNADVHKRGILLYGKERGEHFFIYDEKRNMYGTLDSMVLVFKTINPEQEIIAKKEAYASHERMAEKIQRCTPGYDNFSKRVVLKRRWNDLIVYDFQDCTVSDLGDKEEEFVYEEYHKIIESLHRKIR